MVTIKDLQKIVLNSVLASDSVTGVTLLISIKPVEKTCSFSIKILGELFVTTSHLETALKNYNDFVETSVPKALGTQS